MSAAPRKTVLLVGNPNAGKTTLFNALTGARAKVGNYPGVTVERRVGTFTCGDRPVELIDLPGTYSLTARSREEQIAIEAVLGLDGRVPDALVVVSDATALARSLYLAVQCAETGRPVVVALKVGLWDAFESKRIAPSPAEWKAITHKAGKQLEIDELMERLWAEGSAAPR